MAALDISCPPDSIHSYQPMESIVPGVIKQTGFFLVSVQYGCHFFLPGQLPYSIHSYQSMESIVPGASILDFSWCLFSMAALDASCLCRLLLSGC